ncbi:hypothetical protein DFH06DRAFT_1150338 [Mycena polygramma]|nr:hypothetical protein DFH06DRAFT_1150338 [Mycena polygramma]
MASGTKPHLQENPARGKPKHRVDVGAAARRLRGTLTTTTTALLETPRACRRPKIFEKRAAKGRLKCIRMGLRRRSDQRRNTARGTTIRRLGTKFSCEREHLGEEAGRKGDGGGGTEGRSEGRAVVRIQPSAISGGTDDATERKIALAPLSIQPGNIEVEAIQPPSDGLRRDLLSAGGNEFNAGAMVGFPHPTALAAACAAHSASGRGVVAT